MIALEGIVAAVVALGGCGAMIWKQGISLGKLFTTVEDQKVSIENMEKSQLVHGVDCSRYRDEERDKLDNRVKSLEHDLEKILENQETLEKDRRDMRFKDERRWRKTEDTLLRITTLLEATFIPTPRQSKTPELIEES